MKRSAICCYMILAMLLTLASLPGERNGRIDAGPIWMRIKFKADEKTVHKVDMWGARLDTAFLPFKNSGICIKPFAFGGKSAGSGLFSLGASLGHYTPVSERFTLLPLVGYSHTKLHTRIDLPYQLEDTLIILPNQKEKIASHNFYIGGEITFKINKDWYLTGIYNYGWARVHTKISNLVNTKGGSSGSNVGFLLDYYFNETMSANLGFAYNTSLDKERYGTEGFGFKLGLSYLF